MSESRDTLVAVVRQRHDGSGALVPRAQVGRPAGEQHLRASAGAGRHGDHGQIAWRGADVPQHQIDLRQYLLGMLPAGVPGLDVEAGDAEWVAAEEPVEVVGDEHPVEGRVVGDEHGTATGGHAVRAKLPVGSAT